METLDRITGTDVYRFSVAPMMACTDRHYRYFARLLTRRARLYTEMVTADALLRGPSERLLSFDEAEHPVALQLGGSDPAKMAAAARLGADAGYDEVNLNCGCPSDRVQSGRFGACLMAEPALVADMVRAMRASVDVPVTVKTRIGIDDRDDLAFLLDFVGAVYDAGCRVLILHARKAWLSGLSPKENREIPPLDYSRAASVKAAFPDLTVVLNGGIGGLSEAREALSIADGVMVGRAAYHTPAWLASVDETVFGEAGDGLTPAEAVDAYLPYIERERAAGTPLGVLVKPLIGLFHGARGGRQWRRYLSENMHRPGAGADVVRAALGCVAPVPEKVSA